MVYNNISKAKSTTVREVVGRWVKSSEKKSGNSIKASAIKQTIKLPDWAKIASAEAITLYMNSQNYIKSIAFHIDGKEVDLPIVYIQILASYLQCFIENRLKVYKGDFNNIKEPIFVGLTPNPVMFANIPYRDATLRFKFTKIDARLFLDLFEQIKNNYKLSFAYS